MKELIHSSTMALEEVLLNSGPETAIATSRSQIEKEIANIARQAKFPKFEEGKRFLKAREHATLGVLSRIRDVGGQALFLGRLTESFQASITENWKSDWKNAPSPWMDLNNLKLWRCGGAIFALGSKTHEGAKIPWEGIIKLAD